MTNDIDKLYARYVTDPTILGALLEQISSYACAVARRRGNADPENVGQDVMLRVWDRLSAYDPCKCSFRGWVKSITQNLMRSEAALLENRLTDKPGDLPEPAESPNNVIDIYLSKYTLRERAILYWTAIDQDFCLTAKRFGWTPQALRRRLHRIKEKYEAAA